MKKRRSPQEKKVLSYMRDRMEVFAESRSIARRAIRQRKRFANSAYRLAQKNALKRAPGVGGDPLEQADLAALGVSRKHGKASWRKQKAVPLLRYRDAHRNPGWGTFGRSTLYGEDQSYIFPPTDSPPARTARSRLIKKRGR